MFGGNSLEMYMGTGIFLEISRGGEIYWKFPINFHPPPPRSSPNANDNTDLRLPSIRYYP